MRATRISGIALGLALTLGGASIAAAQQTNSQQPSLMQERQGTVGTDQQAPKPAEQSGKLSGANKNAEDEAKAATGGGTEGGMQFGPKGDAANSLPVQRQGTIGTQERPPEPTTQGGAKQ
ncbi:hypothetical protein [Skermanella stibiiresistens]|nr:hypothetical protein [Skermanella stibiiresistens]